MHCSKVLALIQSVVLVEAGFLNGERLPFRCWDGAERSSANRHRPTGLERSRQRKPACPVGMQVYIYMSYGLNSLKGGYVGVHIVEYYRGYHWTV